MSTKHAEGFFVYLRQNPGNKRDPYDLVPFRTREKEAALSQAAHQKGRAKAGAQGAESKEDAQAESECRASFNLHVVEHFRDGETKKLRAYFKA